MLKRIGTLLLAIGLIGLGVLFFLPPEKHYLVQLLSRFWPIFLILAGLIRVAGYLLDRHPRSPVGGLMISAIGGIILAAGFSGRQSFLQILGHYWFWLLLSLIIGRVLKQYTHNFDDGPVTRAFSPGANILMLLIVGTGLTANFLARNPQYIGRMNLQLGKLGNARDYFLGSEINIEDEAPITFNIPSEKKIAINNPIGNIEIEPGQQLLATARIVKKIRSTNNADAVEIAKNIHLKSTSDGKTVSITSESSDVEQNFSTTIIVSLPVDVSTLITVDNSIGSLKVQGVNGRYEIKNTERVEIADVKGSIRIDAPRGAVDLKNISGDIQLNDLRRNANLSMISGSIRIEAQGNKVVVDKASGPVDARISDGRLELTDIGMNLPQSTRSEQTVFLHNVSNSQLILQGIKGLIVIDAQITGVEASAVSGGVKINSTFKDIKASDINGDVSVTSDTGDVRIENVRGDVTVETDKNITARNVKGLLNVTSRTGGIDLSVTEKLTANIRAVNEKGRLKISIPEDFEYRLDASSEFGKVRMTGFDKFTASQRDRSRIAGYNLLDSAPLVTLQSSRGEIVIQSSGNSRATP